MPSGRLPALVTPALIAWARRTAGFDVAGAAQKLKISDAVFASWEAGASRPSIAQARKMATLFKRPLAVFYLAVPPDSFTPLRDFRTVSALGRKIDTPTLAVETRRAHQRREAAIVLARSLAETPPDFSVSATLNEDPTNLANRLREALAVGLSEQFAWKDPYSALNAWKAAAEGSGALVFQTENLPIREARGFSLALFPLPVVALNSKDTPRGRIFTLMHELSHIALRASGICDLHDDQQSSAEADRVEVFCNRVAGLVLMPAQSLRSAISALGLSVEEEWGHDALKQLADLYVVSHDAALRSLTLAGLYPSELYSERHEAFVRAHQAEKARKKAGRVPYFRRALSWSGRRFARMALSAYDEQRISGADLTEFLRVKMKQVEQIRAALKKGDQGDGA